MDASKFASTARSMKARVEKILIDHKVNQKREETVQAAEYQEDSLGKLKAENRALQIEVSRLRTECLHAEDKYRSHYERIKQEERLRRSEWELKKVAEIREETIRQIAPDIERILHKHKLEREIWSRQTEGG